MRFEIVISDGFRNDGRPNWGDTIYVSDNHEDVQEYAAAHVADYPCGVAIIDWHWLTITVLKKEE